MTDFVGKTIRGEYSREGAVVWLQNARLWRAANGMPLSYREHLLRREDLVILACDLQRLAREMAPPAGRRWLGHVPAECQVSKRPITDEFVDGALKIGGHWAIMHPECHAYSGVGIGVGKGQRYRLAEDGYWRKVEG